MGLNTEHLNTKYIGILNVLKLGFPMVGFGMVGLSNSYSYGPDHSKTKQLEIGTKWQPFCAKWNSIRKPNAIGNQNRRLPLEFRTRWVF